ncbi:hypothetical protein RJ639_024713 [Escallonia herrerae]|uniref:Uncharacterized protein n=1 Tax=Escallonia herrerae TaxID=1293975 RepID=A0AA88UXM8_9ASTE|nr:hypothetical protein RJ639_024713 [Escallonia herrerae]
MRSRKSAHKLSPQEGTSGSCKGVRLVLQYGSGKCPGPKTGKGKKKALPVIEDRPTSKIFLCGDIVFSFLI